MIMKLFPLAAFYWLALLTPVVGECEAPPTVTELNFFDSTLAVNTLHLPGGELRYEGIGTFMDESLDLKVTVSSGDYTNIAGYWAARGKVPEAQNGLGGRFGKINLQTKKNVAHSGEGNFQFCIVKTIDSSPVVLTNFSFAIWDLDWRTDEDAVGGVSVKEKLIIDTAQALNYSVFPNFDDSEVKPICENGDEIVCTDADCSGVHPGHGSCPPGVRTVFRASAHGTGPDNPDHPENLNELQRKRAVFFVFENTDCFELTYAHYCPQDDPANLYDAPSNEANCRMGQWSGGNFLFSGESDALFYEPGCPTAAPTMSIAPSFSPTAAPVDPTPAPVEPTDAPVAPVVEPTDAPVVEPTDAPVVVVEPTDAPVVEPTDAPVEPTDSPVYVGDCPASSGGTGTRYGVMKLCVRSSLGYTYNTRRALAAVFQEVNFIESLITIRYNLDAGFCVDSFSVEPKERLETTASKDTYALEAWLCDPDDTEDLTAPIRTLPKRITTYNAVGGTDAFNQGALITVCVAPDDPTYSDGVRLASLNSFDWYRDSPYVTQPAIETGSASGNFLTSYDDLDCSNAAEFCHFSSVLFADFYISPGEVYGSGNADLEFDPSRRRRLRDGSDEELLAEQQRRRRFEEEDATNSFFDLAVSVDVGEDDPGSLKTAGGPSMLLRTGLASVSLVAVSVFTTAAVFLLA